MRARLSALSSLLALSGCTLFFGDDREGIGAGASTDATSPTAATGPASGATSSTGGTSSTTSSGGAGPGGLGGAGVGGAGVGGAGVGGAGVGGEGAGEPIGCGTTSLLSDDFDDRPRSERLWFATEEGATVDLVASAVVLTPVEDGGTGSLTSSHIYSLRNDAVVAHVVQTLAQAAGRVSGLHIISGDTEVGIETEKGELRMVAGPVGGVEVIDATNERVDDNYWRIRHRDGRILFETSPDGESYVRFGDLADDQLGDIDSVRASLVVSADNAADAGEMRVDDLRGGQGSALACGSSSFGDAFETGEVSPEWNVYEERCSLTENDGRLEVHIPAGDPVFCSYATARLYDLRGDFVSVQVATPPPFDDSIGMGIDFFDLHTRGASMGVVAGQLHLFEIGDEFVPLAQLPLEAGEEPWLRFRVVGADTLFETSADGIDWVTRVTRPTWFDPSQVELRLFVGSNVVLDADVDAAFDDYDLPPS